MRRTPEPHMEDPAANADDSCLVCNKAPEDCICPECLVCGEQGDPNCYKRVKDGGKDHLYLNRAQLVAKSQRRILQLEDDISDEGQYQHWLETCDDKELPQKEYLK